MTTEATEMRDNMNIVDNFGGGDEQRTIAEAEMWDNVHIGDIDTRRWRWQQWRKHGKCNRRNSGTRNITIIGRRLR